MINKDKPKAPTGSSITALSVHSAYLREAKRRTDRSFICSEELTLAERIKNAYISHEPNTALWMLEQSIEKMPYFLKHRFFNNCVAPAYDSLMLSRKYMVRQLVRTAIENLGVENIIFLGAGLDPTGFMTAQNYSSCNVFELDKPGFTRDTKIDVLTECSLHKQKLQDLGQSNYCLNNNLHFLACDFSDESSTKVFEQLAEFQGKSLFIAEGLMIYLNEQALNQLLAQTYSAMDEGDLLFLSFNDSVKASRIEGTVISSTKETYQSSLKPNQVPSFMGKYGFDTLGQIDHSDRLFAIGCENDAYYYQSKECWGKDEIYYLTSKNSSLLEEKQCRAIDDVPHLTIEFHLEDLKELCPELLSTTVNSNVLA